MTKIRKVLALFKLAFVSMNEKNYHYVTSQYSKNIVRNNWMFL